jgi:cytochrome c oxidase subunit 1
VGTLEWTLTGSPPVRGNFEQIPQVLRGPHVFSALVLETELGRDYLGQAEPLPAGVDEP